MADAHFRLTIGNGDASIAHIDFAALESFRFPDGLGYPPSYQAFVRECGWARTFGLWLIYPPVLPGYADGRERADNLTARFLDSYLDGQSEEFDWMVEPDGTWGTPASLRVFGWSENGDALLWDTSARRRDGEFPVWESRGLNALHLLGGSLAEALPLLRERANAHSAPADCVDVEPLTPARL
ncbi:hypothetical protein JOD62_002579 [Microbacterium keratanolyticum]|uniref:SMI1/KNR4 family protein n=1 Tax=Microbacterium keratanolyticum TaxID=67574 RepID=A0A9W6HTH6_9MICO|nr:hypothetical protein [Microbacterium keratanolyticum]MBM7470031.1 hypothetical protein [Microbacterium keratanolyticum]GLK02110.1 hypothetical protein GCM10017596_18250 [Microbacterium keratanolyticum]